MRGEVGELSGYHSDSAQKLLFRNDTGFERIGEGLPQPVVCSPQRAESQVVHRLAHVYRKSDPTTSSERRASGEPFLARRLISAMALLDAGPNTSRRPRP